MKKIIAALDLQHQTSLIVTKAVELASKFEADLHLIHVIKPMGVYISTSMADPLTGVEAALLPNELDLMENNKRMAEEQLQRISIDLKLKEVVIKVLLGSIEEEVAHYVQETNADLLVIGAHWHSGLFRLLNGETSHKILHEAKTPILVIPTGTNH